GTGDTGEKGDKRETGGSRSWLYATAATACFAYCVYSYFYIWTTAAAFLACLVLVWIVERPATFKQDIKSLGVLVVAWGAALIPYAYLLSLRSSTMDHVQLLVHTRMPDLNRMPEWIALGTLVLLIIGLIRK